METSPIYCIHIQRAIGVGVKPTFSTNKGGTPVCHKRFKGIISSSKNTLAVWLDPGHLQNSFTHPPVVLKPDKTTTVNDSIM